MSDKIYPCLWFDGNGEAAAEFYCSIFPNSKIINKTPFVVIYELDGVRYMNLNGGPEFQFNEAVSFVISCNSQDEIDHYWQKLSSGGEEGKCGWLKDKFGVSWQVVPKVLGELMSNPSKAPKVMYAFMKMKKFVIADLLEAAEN